jgi:hypothetical protein
MRMLTSRLAFGGFLGMPDLLLMLLLVYFCENCRSHWPFGWCVVLWYRTEGGIPPLVRLLESNDAKVQRAAAGALRTLAFKNEANKNQVFLRQYPERFFSQKKLTSSAR